MCPTLRDPMDHSPPGSSVHGISQARILEWVAISFSRGYSRPRDGTQFSCIAGKFFTIWATRETPFYHLHVYKCITIFFFENGYTIYPFGYLPTSLLKLFWFQSVWPISLHNNAGTFEHQQINAHTIQEMLLILENRIHGNSWFPECLCFPFFGNENGTFGKNRHLEIQVDDSKQNNFFLSLWKMFKEVNVYYAGLRCFKLLLFYALNLLS